MYDINSLPMSTFRSVNSIFNYVVDRDYYRNILFLFPGKDIIQMIMTQCDIIRLPERQTSTGKMSHCLKMDPLAESARPL